MTHLTETDMRSLEGALDDCYCHLFPGYVGTPAEVRPFAWCGVPRSEQSPHGGHTRIGGSPEFCPQCGARRCPLCIRKSREAARW